MPRPIPIFEAFVGQRKLVRFLKMLLEGFREAEKILPPLLLVAPTGFGKTAFAEALAAAAGTKLHLIFACDKLRPEDLYSTLRHIQWGDFVFIDEAHLLGRAAQHALYLAVDRFMIPALEEIGQVGKSTESIGQFTLVLATNYPGQIHKALRSRTTQLHFEPYSHQELKLIAQQIAKREGIHVSPQAAGLIAASAQGTPRHVYKRLETLALFAPNEVEYTLGVVRECLDCEGIDRYGLNIVQRSYLRAIAAVPKKRCSLDQIATRLGLDGLYIKQECENFLVEQGYVELASNNYRRLTDKGIEVLASLESQT